MTGAIVQRYARRAASFEHTLATIGDADWDNPTPCPQWTARDVVRHVVLLHELVLRTLGRRLRAAPERDPVSAFHEASAGVAAVLTDPALATRHLAGTAREPLERWIDTVIGTDLVLHEWDLARATGQDDTMNPLDVALLWPGGRPLSGLTADDQDRLLGYNGRDPHWQLPRPRPASD